MNRLYKTEESIDAQIIGNSYPQIVKLPKNYNDNKSNSLYNIGYDSLPDFTPDLMNLPLDVKAKITDVLSCTYLSRGGWLVSERLKRILEDFHLPVKHSFYTSSIFSGGKSLTYFYFYFISDLLDSLNFRKSKFYVGRSIHFKSEELLFKDKDDFLKGSELLRKKRIIFTPEVLVFKKGIPPIDITSILPRSGETYVSKRLMHRLIEEKITGLEFQINSKNPEIIFE